jgi:hypothetical protein
MAKMLTALLASLTFAAYVRADEPLTDRRIMERLAKNLRSVEERLGKNDPGAGTQQIQRDIVKDLEELMAQAKRQGSSEQSQASQSGASMSKGQRSSETRTIRNEQGAGRGEQAASRQSMHPGQSQAATAPPEKKSTSKDQMSKIADLYKDVWGHLPETLRQEMDQYSREQFMDKYQELLKQYYATIAEKSKRPRGSQSAQ